MATSIESTKVELIQWLTTLEDKSILIKLKEFQESVMSSKEYVLNEEENIAVEEGLSEYESGKIHPHEDVKKLYEKWL